MKAIEAIIGTYLQKSGNLEPIRLGPESKQREPKKEDLFLVAMALKNNMKKCNQVITVANILLFILVAFFIWIGVFTAFQGKAIVLLGGSFLSLVFILKRLIDSAIAKSTITATLAIINNQPPEFQEKALEALYWNLLKKNGK